MAAVTEARRNYSSNREVENAVRASLGISKGVSHGGWCDKGDEEPCGMKDPRECYIHAQATIERTWDVGWSRALN